MAPADARVLLSAAVLPDGSVRGRMLICPYEAFSGNFPMRGTYFFSNELFEHEATGEVTLPASLLGRRCAVYLGRSVEGILRKRGAPESFRGGYRVRDRHPVVHPDLHPPRGLDATPQRGGRDHEPRGERRQPGHDPARRGVPEGVARQGKRERKAFSQAEDAKRHAEATAFALSRGDAAAVGLTGADAAVFGAACERLAEFRTSITEAVSSAPVAMAAPSSPVTRQVAAPDMARDFGM
jgi:hypothetical protein